jgi:hypothetical protein
VQNWFYALGLRGTASKPKRRRAEKASKVKRWFEEHPHVGLARSIVESSRMMGVSRSALASYLNRRRDAVRAYVESLGRLEARSKPFDATTRSGTEIIVPPKAIAHYGVAVDRWTLEVTYAGNLKAGVAFVVRMPYAKVRDFWKEEAK